MAYQNGTTHYNLPQTIGTDKRDWSDTNQAFADVDAALYNAANGANINKTDIDKLKIDVAANTQQITTNTGNIATNTADIGTNTGAISKLQSDLQTSQTDLHNEIADVRNDAEDMITAYNEPNAVSTHQYAVGDYFIYNDILYKATSTIAVGDTIVPNTNCTATNVTTELKSLSGDTIIKIDANEGESNEDCLGRLWTAAHGTLDALTPIQLAKTKLVYYTPTGPNNTWSYDLTHNNLQNYEFSSVNDFDRFSSGMWITIEKIQINNVPSGGRSKTTIQVPSSTGSVQGSVQILDKTTLKSGDYFAIIIP